MGLIDVSILGRMKNPSRTLECSPVNLTDAFEVTCKQNAVCFAYWKTIVALKLFATFNESLVAIVWCSFRSEHLNVAVESVESVTGLTSNPMEKSFSTMDLYADSSEDVALSSLPDLRSLSPENDSIAGSLYFTESDRWPDGCWISFARTMSSCPNSNELTLNTCWRKISNYVVAVGVSA